jgi:hypothetical protein
MKHKASQDLFAYWNRLRGIGTAPERNEIEPGAIRGALGDTIMLAREGAREATFRLAGTRVCALFCRELKNNVFQELWDDDSRRILNDLIEHVGNESTGFIAGAVGQVEDGTPVVLELLLLPLLHRGATDGRLIGTLAPLASPVWLGMQSVQKLTLTSWRYVGPEIDGAVVPRFVDLPQNAPELVVHEGRR